jgi:large subunit ribosomal protein L1
MGKIRIKTIGDDELEKKDLKKAQARSVAKKAREEAEARRAATASDSAENETKKDTTSNVANPEKEETPTPPTNPTTQTQAPAETKGVTDEKKDKKAYKKAEPKKIKSQSYKKAAVLVERNKRYKLAEALPLLEQMKRVKFDETVELHINTIEKGISGSLTLPHGTGKATRVVIANAASDPKNVDELIKKIESGKIDFDVLIATPDTMPKLAKVARVLGPRGLMPNPKNGTVTPKPDEVAKRFEGGQFNFKTEAKFPILHLTVGKLSFGDKKLTDNINTAIKAVKTKNIKDITLKSTMSPGIKIETASL